MKLSIAIATHNEANNILHCLESVYDWADEIVVVDGESIDNTVKIIKDFDKDQKIHIFHEKNPPMFHINKQKAIEQCKGEWILQLDGDEIVTSQLKEEVGTIVSRELVAYWIPRLNYFLGKPLRKGGQYPDMTIRLYKNGVGRFPCKSVHEQIEITGETGRLKSDLLHYPYPTFDAYLEKWMRYAVLEAEIWKQQGIRPSFFNSLKYFIILPKWWFLKTYVRHRGYADGFPGLVFSLFSACRYWITYVKLYELQH